MTWEKIWIRSHQKQSQELQEDSACLDLLAYSIQRQSSLECHVSHRTSHNITVLYNVNITEYRQIISHRIKAYKGLFCTVSGMNPLSPYLNVDPRYLTQVRAEICFCFCFNIWDQLLCDFNVLTEYRCVHFTHWSKQDPRTLRAGFLYYWRVLYNRCCSSSHINTYNAILYTYSNILFFF